MDKEEKTISSKLIYKGRIINLYNDEIMCPNGHKAEREYVHHPGGVCILPLYNGYIYFIKQFRYPYHKELLELPAGKLEGLEDPKNAAYRELKEEIGFTSENLEYMGYFYPTCGYTDEVLYLYYSENNIVGDDNPDEDEILELVKLTPKEAYELLDNNKIEDGKTIILLEKLRNRLLK